MKATTHSTRSPGIAGVLLLTLALLLPAGGPLMAQAGGVVELDRIVAVVNNDVIMASELQRQMTTVERRLRQQKTPLPAEELLRKQVLERLILEHLQLQLAEQTGVRVDDETLNTTLADVAAKNKMTLDEMRRTLVAEGYSFAQYREDIRQQLILNRLRTRQVVSKITVTDDEVANFLSTAPEPRQETREYHLAHILIAVPEAASSEQIRAAQARAGQVLEELRSGADFAQKAVAMSDGQQALEGGDLGWRQAEQIPTLFADVVKDLKPGEISDPLRSPSGFHIVKLVETRGEKRHVVRQTRLQHILVRPSDTMPEDDARRRLEQVRQRIEAGEEFAALARSHSDDTVSAVKGGVLGWISPGDLVPDFEQVMNALRPGQTSQPFKTQFGWHIVQVLERRDFDSSEQFIKSRAREVIAQRKIEEESAAWLRRLRDEAYVEYRLEE